MNDLQKIARVTGAWYLGLALTGMFGFLLIRPRLYVPTDAALTAKHLLEQGTLAHVGVALELGIVVTQAMAALSFYRLLRGFDPVAAWGTAAFGLANAMAILVSAACMHTALQVTANPNLAPGGDVAHTVQLLFVLSSGLWAAGAVFFGLWLIPMGQVVTGARIMPAALGWFLRVGGVGYVLSALVGQGWNGASRWLVDGLTIPASIGEFWMIGYLLSLGIRSPEKQRAGGVPSTAGSNP